MRALLAQLLLGILTAHPAFLQTADRPSFDAASIKPNTGPANGTGTVRILRGGRLRAENAMLRAVIQNAYDVKPFEIVGGPAWIDSARYDIEASAAGETSDQEVRRMMQRMLEERFQLRSHREAREVPVYTMNSAKGGLRLAPPKDGGCVVESASQGGARPPAPKAQMQLPCGRVMVRIEMPRARMAGAQVEMAALARVLSNLLWRPVIDRTAYSGKFDMDVEFAADDALGLLAGPYRPDATPPIPVEPGAVSIFTAFQDQLGIKIESGRGPVDVLVIDRIERPSAN
jgi:bla regulator protein blaR1